MALALDERRRAMLQEMGLRVWSPSVAPSPGAGALPELERDLRPTRAPAVADAAPDPASGRLARTAEPPARVSASPVNASVSIPAARPPAGGVDWPALIADVSACSACGLCQGRRAVVIQPEPQSRQTDWLIVGEPPDADEERSGLPFSGDAGRLLDNMLRAVGVRRDAGGAQGARLSNAVRCRPAVPRNPEPAELAACAAHLWQEIAWAQPRVVLAMGRFAAQTLLADLGAEQAGQPLGRLRGQVHRVRGVAVVVTHHPSRLLRAPADKAQAWVDLCLARAVALGHDL